MRGPSNTVKLRIFRPGGSWAANKDVVDRPLHDVAVAQVAIEAHEAVDPADEVCRGAAFGGPEAAILAVREMFIVARRPDYQQVAVTLGQFAQDEAGGVQGSLAGFPSVEQSLGVASGEVDVNVAGIAIPDGRFLPVAKTRKLRLDMAVAVTDAGGVVQIAFLAGGVVEFHEGGGQACGADPIRLWAPRKGRHRVIGQFACLPERVGVAAEAGMFQQSEHDVFLVVQGPIAVVLPPVRLDGHVSEIAIRVARFHQFGHQMVSPPGHLWVAGVGGEAAAGGDDLAHADIAMPCLREAEGVCGRGRGTSAPDR